MRQQMPTEITGRRQCFWMIFTQSLAVSLNRLKVMSVRSFEVAQAVKVNRQIVETGSVIGTQASHGFQLDAGGLFVEPLGRQILPQFVTLNRKVAERFCVFRVLLTQCLLFNLKSLFIECLGRREVSQHGVDNGQFCKAQSIRRVLFPDQLPPPLDNKCCAIHGFRKLSRVNQSINFPRSGRCFPQSYSTVTG